MEYWIDPIAGDPLWVEKHTTSDEHRHRWITYQRLDGLQLWIKWGEWRFKTTDCGHGSIVVKDAWNPKNRKTPEQARAWCDENIELHRPITWFELLYRDVAQPG